MKTENTQPEVIIVHDLFDSEQPSIDYYKTVVNKYGANCHVKHLHDLNGFFTENSNVKKVVLAIHNNLKDMLSLAKELNTSKEVVIFSSYCNKTEQKIVKNAGFQMKEIPIKLEVLKEAINL